MIEIASTECALSHLYGLSLNQSNFRFRGQADFDWSLQPSVYRFSNFQRYQTVNFESLILKAKPPAPMPPLTHTNFDLEWLMICQHYQVPTRLLDWSTDILVALFFACNSEKEASKDGAIFICNQNDYPMFAAYNKSAMESQDLAFISTNIVNPRLRAQAGCFMIWGHAPLSEDTTESYDLWQYQQTQKQPHHLEKLRIRSESKKPILRELKKIYSISHESLYLADGYLERTYGKRFEKLRDDTRLMNLYMTDADRLTPDEEQVARSMFPIDCRNMIGSCVRLREI